MRVAANSCVGKAGVKLVGPRAPISADSRSAGKPPNGPAEHRDLYAGGTSRGGTSQTRP